MTALEGPFSAACALLVLAGGYKILRPNPTTGALRAVRWPAGTGIVRSLGLGEVLLGAAALLSGGRALALAVGLLYVGFTAFVLAALRQGSAIQSCGCFGESETPPTLLHVATNLLLAATAIAAAATGVPALRDVFAGQPVSGAPFVLLVAITVGLVKTLLTDLPRALQALQASRELQASPALRTADS